MTKSPILNLNLDNISGLYNWSLSNNNNLKILENSSVKSCINVLPINSPIPTNPSNGDIYVSPINSVGEWAGKDNMICVYDNNSWSFITPLNGQILLSKEESKFYYYYNGSWIHISDSINTNNLIGISILDSNPMIAIKEPIPNQVTANYVIKILSNIETDMIYYRLVDNTAKSDIDYISQNGSKSIIDNEFSLDIILLPNYGVDTVLSFNVEISKDSNFSNSTFINCDINQNFINIPQNCISVPITVPFVDTIPRVITWETKDGSALSGTDYMYKEDGVLIPPGWKTIYAKIPLTNNAEINSNKTFSIIMKYYDKSKQVGSGVAQCGGIPIYNVVKQNVSATIIDTTIVVDISSIPNGEKYSLVDGTAKSGIDYIPLSGIKNVDSLSINIRKYCRGQPRKYFFINYGDSNIRVNIIPENNIIASSSDIIQNITTISLEPCIPKFSLSKNSSTTDSPIELPMSTFVCIPTDYNVETVGSNPNYRMTLSINSTNTIIRNLGNYFTNYNQINDYMVEITGTAREIAAAATMIQYKPTSNVVDTIKFTLSGNGEESSEEVYIKGMNSSMSIDYTSEIINISNPSYSLYDNNGLLTITNPDPYVEMTLTLEPDIGGGDLVGLTGSSVSRSESGYGYVVKCNQNVMKIVMLSLTIYSGPGTKNTVIKGNHIINLTAFDGINTISSKINYNLS